MNLIQKNDKFDDDFFKKNLMHVKLCMRFVVCLNSLMAIRNCFFFRNWML